MRKYLCLYFPNWSIQLYRRKLVQEDPSSKGKGLVLLTQSANQTLVMRACMRAKANGVREGMCFEMARTLCPELLHRPFMPQEDFKRLYQLALWAIQFTPLVGMDQILRSAYTDHTLAKASPLYNGLILDITGTDRLHGSSKSLAKRILLKLGQAKLSAKIGIAPNIGGAWALSRFKKGAGFGNPLHSSQREKASLQIFESTKCNLKDCLEELPVAALRICPETQKGLHELGIVEIAQLLKLPRKKILSRFGVDLIKRIDQALGDIEESFPVVKSKEDISAKAVFEFPLQKQESIHKATLSLVEKVAIKLSKQGKKASSFLLTFQGKDAQDNSFVRHKEITLNTASQKAAHISSIISSVLEDLKVPRGISHITVCSKHTEHFTGTQEEYLKSLSPLLSSIEANGEFLNNIVARIGGERVKSLELYESHIPEKAFRYKPIEKKHGEKKASDEKGFSLVFDYPSKLFETPKPIQAISLLPDKPPSRIQWEGKSLKVIKSLGPERLSEQWWESTLEGRATERDYFKIQDHHGRWLWVYRNQKDFRWFVHGVWG